jgi:hypothetical protein
MFSGLEGSIYEILATIGVFAGGLALWFMAGKKWLGIGLMIASFAWAYIRFIQPLIAS